MRDRLITPPPGYYLCLLREEYLAICEGNHCAAVILSQHEYWHNHNLEQRGIAQHQNRVAQLRGQKPDQNTSLWLPMSHEQMQKQLFGMFGEKKIGDAYKYLVKAGFLKFRNNPKQDWDRKPQYLFALDDVQAAVNNLPAKSVNEPDELPAESIPQNCGEDGVGLRSRDGETAESSPPKCGDSKNLSENKKEENFENAATPTRGSASLLSDSGQPDKWMLGKREQIKSAIQRHGQEAVLAEMTRRYLIAKAKPHAKIPVLDKQWQMVEQVRSWDL